MSNSSFSGSSILILLFLLLGQLNDVFSQQKELTLEDAILKQYSKFYPERLWKLQWIPETETYSFIERRL